MNRTIAALALCAALLLTGCTAGLTVEDMLSAPALTADQSAVLAALDNYTQEKTLLKYPTSGERRAPIQFVDLDADGVSEAVVFFSVPAEDMYAKLAVLKKTDGAWRMAGVQQGAGTDVESISVIRVEDEDGRFLLVEWSNTNNSGNQLTAYHFQDEQIVPGFEDTISDILVYDLDGDGFREFCYITPGSPTKPFLLKFVDNSGGLLALTGECELNRAMLGSMNITAGLLADGRQAVFVDESIRDGLKATEVFVLDNRDFVPVTLAEGYSLAEISRRAAGARNCQAVFGGARVYIPSEVLPFAEVRQPDSWTYWYTIRDEEIVYSGASYVDESYGIALAIPDRWLRSVAVMQGSPGEPRMIEMRDLEAETVCLRLKILEIGEDATAYLGSGFELITQSGSFRYYVQADCTPEELSYIKSNFSVL